MNFGREERDGPIGRLASNLTPYITMTISGLKPEGMYHPFVIVARDGFQMGSVAAEQAAIALLEAKIRKFLFEEDKPGVIEWRDRPMIERFQNYDGSIADRKSVV